MWQMVFAYDFVQGWINDPNEHWFFDQPGEVLHNILYMFVYVLCIIFPYTRRSHVSWTGKSLCSLKKLVEGGLNEETYRRLYPTAAVPSKFYGLPKIHKPGTPLRPIVSSIGAAIYKTAEELAKILKPLVGMSAHHVQNTRDFVEQRKDIRLKQGECIISYDVTALFTSVPIQTVLNIIKQRLANDKDLQKRTTMSISHITNLLEFCLNSPSFVYQGQFYQQLEGAAMGSPLSPIVANIFMEKFEEALATVPHPPSLLKRYVDDTFVIQEEQYKSFSSR